METGTSQNLRLGIFVVAGIMVLIIGLYFIGENRKMFGKSFKLYANFRNVKGLRTGNSVRYGGIDVGTVKKIDIINDTLIRVDLEVEEKLKSVIRKNALTSIGSDGLMGNTLLNIEQGSEPAPFVKDGDE